MAGDGAGVTHWGHQVDPSPRKSQVLRPKEEVRDKGRRKRSRPRGGRECEGEPKVLPGALVKVGSRKGPVEGTHGPHPAGFPRWAGSGTE